MALAVAEARNPRSIPNPAPCKALLIPVGSEVRIKQYSTLAFLHLWFSWFLTRFHDVQSSWANISNIFFDRSSTLHFKINQNIESSENKLWCCHDGKTLSILCLLRDDFQPTREDFESLSFFIASIQVLLSSSVLFYSTAASFSAWRGVSSSWQADRPRNSLWETVTRHIFCALQLKCRNVAAFFPSFDSISDFGEMIPFIQSYKCILDRTRLFSPQMAFAQFKISGISKTLPFHNLSSIYQIFTVSDS